MHKVFVEDSDYLTAKMFNNRDGYEVTTTLEEADIVCFTGGADIDPSFYHEVNTHSVCDLARDNLSWSTYFQAPYGALLVGICRGGQFLNVMKGGALHQHVEGHYKEHTIEGYGDDLFVSDHHQQMIPNDDLDVLFYKVFKAPDGGVEIVVYNDGEERVLCFQPHPEYVAGSPSERVFFELMEGMM